MTNKTVTKVEPNLGLKSLFRHYNIGIYARVSTGSTDQLHSLGTQVSAFMALYRYNPQAYIYDVYIDVLSGSNPDRPNYKRMLDTTIQLFRYASIKREEIETKERSTRNGALNVRK